MQVVVAALCLWQTHAMAPDAPHTDLRIRALPCWQGSISISVLSGGLSNANYRVQDAAGSHVVRFGVDYPFHHVSRQRELMVARAAAAAGFAPAVEYAAEGVMVTQFLGAKTYTAADVCRETPRIGALLRAFHQSMPARVSGEGYMFWVFHVIRDYINTLRASSEASELSRFQQQAQQLEADQVAMPIVFGHHDLLPANILDDGQKLWLIDFEYAGFGTAMFDLAGVASNAGMNPDQEQNLLYHYLGHAPDAAFKRALSAMACASLLRETLWAMVSRLYLAAPGVDYGAYTTENRTRYHASLEAHLTAYGRPNP
jgi:thiamine kinase-like enzyme